ncbi:protein kinase [Achlya hypogyna]|uniref:Protein kinase n=1 Tax=Achlya hypogyna TaxID=1202772 RepID=A0A1V9YB99_ACHHY|nr:protein kinase [Achlya hypogyna]
MRALVLAALARFALATNSSTCPYEDLPTTANIWTTGSLCAGESPCKVSRTCEVRKDGAAPDAYGDLQSLTTNTTVTLGNASTLDLSHAILPPSASTLTLENVGAFSGFSSAVLPPNLAFMFFINASVGDFPKGLTWPTSLEALYIFNTPSVDVEWLKVPPTMRLLDFWNVTRIANLDKLVLPMGLTEIFFSNCTIQVIPPSLEWPSNLLNLTLIDNQLQDLPHNLPNSLSFLSIHQNYVYDLGTSLPSNLTVLKLRDNRIKEVVNWDFSNLFYFRMKGNPVTTISNVTFSSKIKYFDCERCPIVTFNIDAATFAALDQLEPWDRDDSVPTINFRGFNVLSNITADKSACDKHHGTVRRLWAGKSAVVVDVCVMGSPINYTPIIVGICVGAAVVIAALTTYFCIKRRKLQKKLETYVAASPLGSANIFTNGSTMDLGIGNSTMGGLVNDLGDLEYLRVSGVELHKKLAEGAYGEVWKGSYNGSVVAVKRLLPNKSSPKDILNFINECKLMARYSSMEFRGRGMNALRSFDSAFIVRLYGVSWTRPMDFMAVMEFMDRGDLKSYLAHHAPTAVPWAFKHKVMTHIIKGLVYLHSMQIIHRDLKSRNVLLDSADGETVKLTDFGVSKEDLQETMTVGVGTYRWMAPEILKEGHYSIAADIYSFGILLSELDTHKIPYAGARHPTTNKPLVDTAIMSMVINGTLQPTFSANCPAWVHSIALRCLEHDPEVRPTARQLDLELRRINPTE